MDLSAIENAKKNKGESVLMAVGLRLTSMTLSSMIALIKSGPLIPEWFLSTPQTAMERVIAAKQEEDSIYVPKPKLA